MVIFCSSEILEAGVIEVLVPSVMTFRHWDCLIRHFPDELSLDRIQTRNALHFNNDPYPAPNVCGPFVIFPASHPGSAQSARRERGTPERFSASISGSAQSFSVGNLLFHSLIHSRARYVTSGGGRASRAMRSRIAANKFRVTATSAS